MPEGSYSSARMQLSQCQRGCYYLLQRPVRLNSFLQNFWLLVCDLYWQNDLLMIDQITSSCCILEDQTLGPHSVKNRK